MRINRVIKKEFKEFIHDRGFIFALILLPILLIAVFGYTFQANITNLNTIVIDEDGTNFSQTIVDAVDESEYFNMIPFEGTLEEAKQKLNQNAARAIFYIPKGFGERLDNAQQAELYLYLDSSDYTIYNILKGASGGTIKDSLQDIMKLIVDKLEEERDYNQHRVDDIRKSIDALDEKKNNTLSNIKQLSGSFDELQAILVDTESKIESNRMEISSMKSDLNSIERDVRNTRSSLDGLMNALNEMKATDPDLAPSLDPIIDDIASMKSKLNDMLSDMASLDPSSRIPMYPEYYNLDTMNLKLESNEAVMQDINNTANQIKTDAEDIEARVNEINIELKTLKKEFLSEPVKMTNEYVFGEISYFQYLTPAILTLILFFIGFVMTTINIIDERNNKTLFRISTTPLKKVEMLGGKFAIFFFIGIIETIYVLLLAMFMFNVVIVGGFLDVICVLLLLMAAAIGLGLLISSTVKTMRQAVMLIPLVVIPSILISQTFSPIEVMPRFMQYVAYLSPMFYSNVALREIMIKGTALSGVSMQIIILAIYAAATLLLGVFVSKKRIE